MGPPSDVMPAVKTSRQQDGKPDVARAQALTHLLAATCRPPHQFVVDQATPTKLVLLRPMLTIRLTLSSIARVE